MTTSSTLPPGPGEGHVRGAAICGGTGRLVDVSARIADGPDRFTITGLSDDLAWPARDRVRAAVLNSNLTWPGHTVAAELRPPRQPCTGIDLPIGIAVLTAAGTIPAGPASHFVLIADLGLDGSLRPVHGVLPAVTAAAHAGLTVAIVAPRDAAEAVLIPACPPSQPPRSAPSSPGCADDRNAVNPPARPP
jgi:magnesium chelatase family protein